MAIEVRRLFDTIEQFFAVHAEMKAHMPLSTTVAPRETQQRRAGGEPGSRQRRSRRHACDEEHHQRSYRNVAAARCRPRFAVAATSAGGVAGGNPSRPPGLPRGMQEAQRRTAPAFHAARITRPAPASSAAGGMKAMPACPARRYSAPARSGIEKSAGAAQRRVVSPGFARERPVFLVPQQKSRRWQANEPTEEAGRAQRRSAASAASRARRTARCREAYAFSRGERILPRRAVTMSSLILPERQKKPARPLLAFIRPSRPPAPVQRCSRRTPSSAPIEGRCRAMENERQ